MGGLSKKAFQFKKLIETRKAPSLIVDGGALFFDSIRPYRYKFDQVKVKAEGIVKAYNMIGSDAVGVAGQDLAGGLDLLLELAKGSKFAWLSANLVDKVSGRPYFQSHITKELGTTRVAITGLTSSEIVEARLLDEKADIRNWQDVLPPLLNELKKRHDFIILLTDLAPDICAAISRQHPEVRLIIRAGGYLENHPPQQTTSSTLIASTGRQGKYLGALEVNWIKGGDWGKPDGEGALLKEKKKDLDRTTAHLKRIQNSPESQTLVGNLERKKDILAAEVAELKQRVEKRHVSLFTNTFYEMSEHITDDPEVLAVVMQIRENVAALIEKRSALGVGSESGIPAGYIGWQACAGCHGKAVSVWQKTRHAGAYATLVRKNRQNDFDCLPCHVTGIDFENVARAVSLPVDLQAVGCEVCHGPGKEHAEQASGAGMEKVSARVCIRCHVPEHDDSHDFDRDVLKIKCDR